MLSKQELKKRIEILINKLNLGLIDEVILESQIFLKKNKNEIVINILSIAYITKGLFDESISLLEKFLKKEPNNYSFLNNLGLSFLKKGDFIKAQYNFKRSLDIKPNQVQTLNNFGSLMRDLEKPQEAINYFKKALILGQNIFETNYNLASVYQSIGNYDLSLKFFHKALLINSKFTVADRNISLMTKYTNNDAHFKSMKKKYDDKKLSNYQLPDLLFGLSKAYDDMEDYKMSFKFLKEANDKKKQETNYNVKKDLELFENIKKVFKNKINLSSNIPNKKFIFIVGMPRSGTTLIEQVISSHPEVFGGGELTFLQDIEKMIFKKKSKHLSYNDIFENIKKSYIEKTAIIDKEKKIFTDKAPLNFRWIGFLNLMFPNSKIIHCTRNSLETCWSIYKNGFDGDLNFSNNFDDLGNFFKGYLDLMDFWKNKLNEKIYDVNYEKFVNNSKKETERLLNFCELSWDNSCLKHHKNSKSIKTVSAFQARQPIYNSSLNKSKNYIEFIKELTDILGK